MVTPSMLSRRSTRPPTATQLPVHHSNKPLTLSACSSAAALPLTSTSPGMGATPLLLSPASSPALAAAAGSSAEPGVKSSAGAAPSGGDHTTSGCASCSSTSSSGAISLLTSNSGSNCDPCHAQVDMRSTHILMLKGDHWLASKCVQQCLRSRHGWDATGFCTCFCMYSKDATTALHSPASTMLPT